VICVGRAEHLGDTPGHATIMLGPQWDDFLGGRPQYHGLFSEGHAQQGSAVVHCHAVPKLSGFNPTSGPVM